MKTAASVPFWSKGKHSFLSDPPNAHISILEGDQLRQIVAVPDDAVLRADGLTSTAKVLPVDMPAKGADVSVFIDIIGLPFTPLPIADVGRRTAQRAYWYGAAAPYYPRPTDTRAIILCRTLPTPIRTDRLELSHHHRIAGRPRRTFTARMGGTDETPILVPNVAPRARRLCAAGSLAIGRCGQPPGPGTVQEHGAQLRRNIRRCFCRQ